MRLEQKVCIITGGGSGIGRATFLLFADEGARLVVADKRATSAQAVASECAGKGAQAIAVEANVASHADVNRMIAATVERFGRLDILVNNAGSGILGMWSTRMKTPGMPLCSKYDPGHEGQRRWRHRQYRLGRCIRRHRQSCRLLCLCKGRWPC